MDDKRREDRLIELIGRLKGGTDVATRDMRSVLTDAQYVEFEERWDEQRRLRIEAKDKPSSVIEYEQRLKKALFEDSKADRWSRARSAGKTQVSRQTVDQAVSRAKTEFERLLEFLEEQTSLDPGLHLWFDRALVFGLNGGLTPDRDGVPQVRTSKSLGRVGSAGLAGTQRKRTVKLEVLENALEHLRSELARKRSIELQLAKLDAARDEELKAERAALRRREL